MPTLSPEEFSRRVAFLCCQKFDELPKTGKPQQREWTVLAGVVQCSTDDDILDRSGSICSTSLQCDQMDVEFHRSMQCKLASHIDSASSAHGDSASPGSPLSSKNLNRSGNISALQLKDPSHLKLSVVALGSGTKCLGDSEWCPRGSRVHDSHAEVIAKRAFQRYLMDQVASTFSGKSSVFEAQPTTGNVTSGVKLHLKKSISYHLFVSTTPCGDASIFPQNFSADKDGISTVVEEVRNIELSARDPSGSNEPPFKKMKTSRANTIVADSNICIPVNPQAVEADTHRTGAKCAPGEKQDSRLSGAAYHRTGCLRTKPGRGAPSSSHSCSDKLFRWSVLGAQGCLLMAFLQSPVYFESFTVAAGASCLVTMERALNDRYSASVACLPLPSDFTHHKYIISKSNVTFKYSSVEVIARVGKEHAMPCPTSVCWFESSEGTNFQVIVDGRKHGVTKKNLATRKGQVVLCRAQMFAKVLELHELRWLLLHGGQTSSTLQSSLDRVKCLNYRQLKQSSELYSRAWQALRSAALVNWTKKPEEFQSFGPHDS